MTDRTDALIEQVRRDAGGAFITGLAYIGDRLGLFRVLADCGPLDGGRMARAARIDEAYASAWLQAMAAFGYVDHDPAAGTYRLASEQAAVLADESSPAFATGTFQFALASLLHTEQIETAFREGGGIGYEELREEIPVSIDRMHRPWFDHLLTGVWLPAIAGLEPRLRGGIDVLDVGCGQGRSTLAMADAYPSSTITGVDPHEASIAAAAAAASRQGVGNARFVDGTLEELAASGDASYELVLAIDCIHDMADPIGALAAIRHVLADDGLLVWSEPTGSRNPLENSAPLPRLRAALSPYHCLSVSLASGGPGLGTLIGEEGARSLASAAGYDDLEILPVPGDTQMFFGLRR